MFKVKSDRLPQAFNFTYRLPLTAGATLLTACRAQLYLPLTASLPLTAGKQSVLCSFAPLLTARSTFTYRLPGSNSLPQAYRKLFIAPLVLRLWTKFIENESISLNTLACSHSLKETASQRTIQMSLSFLSLERLVAIQNDEK